MVDIREGDKPANHLVKDVLRYAPTTIFPAILGVISAGIFTRIFIPQEYGKLVLINSVTGPIVSVASQMFGQPLGRYFADLQRDGLGSVYSHVLSKVLQTIILVVCGLFIILPGFIWLVEPGLSSWLFLLLGAVFGMGVQSVASLVMPILPLVRDFQGYRRYVLGSAMLALLIPLGLVLWQGAHIIWMLWGVALAGAIMLIPLFRSANAYSSIRVIRITYGEKELRLFRKFLRYGTPMTIWFFAASMIYGSDRYVIGAFLGPGAVAIYGSSYIIATQAIGLLTGPIVTATWPNLMTTWAKTHSVSQVRTIMARATDLYLMLGIGLVGGSVVVGKDVVGIILSPKYFSGYVIVAPVMAGMVIWGASSLGHKSMEIMERNDIMVWNAIVAAVLNVGLNILLVPRFGWQIAAYTTLFSYVAYATATWWLARRMIPWDIRPGRLLLYMVTAAISDVISQLTWSGKSFFLSLMIRGMIFSVIYFGVGVWIHRLRPESVSVDGASK